MLKNIKISARINQSLRYSFLEWGMLRKSHTNMPISPAPMYKIKAIERTDGTLGFWWRGRKCMHRWDMPIEPMMLILQNMSM